jgi:hypothetical protein
MLSLLVLTKRAIIATRKTGTIRFRPYLADIILAVMPPMLPEPLSVTFKLESS